MAAWIAENPKAAKAMVKFVSNRKRGNQDSVSALLNGLRWDFDFPFSSEPSLARHLKTIGLEDRVVIAPPASQIVVDKGVDDTIAPMSKGRAKRIKKARRWVITAAQNNTPVDEGFLSALEHYCEDVGAELLVRPIRYKNANSTIVPDDDAPEGMWWDDRIADYMVDDEIELKDVLIPDVRIAATSGNPLTGLDSRSGTKHGVYGATQLSMKTIATAHNELPKILYSTGAVTVANYSTTKAGNIADFHHSLAAVIVEQDSKGRTFMRSVTWSSKHKNFSDIDVTFYADGGVDAERWEALIPGDEHAAFIDLGVKKATYMNKDSMVRTGNPKVVVRHDLLDCYAVSHHHMGNVLQQRNKEVFGWGNIQTELDQTIAFLDETSVTDAKQLVVSSNHNDHLSQWLSGGEKGVTSENALLYHKLMVWMFESAERTPSGVKMDNPFKMYMEHTDSEGTSEVEFLGGRAPYIIGDIDVSQHGHRGPNGARGSRANLSKIGVKTVIGHSHSPGITGGCWQVGTSSRLDLEYAQGPSSWLHCQCIIHANGKRQLLPVIGGDWRARN
tara:strand:+ start:6271 stop:7944 length:1674 start_codon:yes stop_codon:yes gene_type:complete